MQQYENVLFVKNVILKWKTIKLNVPSSCPAIDQIVLQSGYYEALSTF